MPLGVLVNSEHRAEVLRRRLQRLGLDDMFSAVLSSVDLGHAKPDEVCYLAALEAMDLCAEETAFVGHDGEELEGACAWACGPSVSTAMRTSLPTST